MALTVSATTPAQQTGGTPLVVTFTDTSGLGFLLGDEFFFAAESISGGVGWGGHGGLDNSEAYTSGDDDWVAWNFHPSAVPSIPKLQLWTFAFSPGDPRIGDSSITFTFTGGSFGGTYALSGGIIAGGVVVRGGVGASSEHTNNIGGLIPSSGNDYAESSSILSTTTATVPGHSGEVGAAGNQVEVFMLAGATHTTSQVISNVVGDVGSVASQLNAAGTVGLWFGYEILAEGLSAETGFNAVATWVTGAGGTIRCWAFRVVRLVILENPPVCDFFVTDLGSLTGHVDMTASSDPDTTIPATWDVDWGDGNSTLGLNRSSGTVTSNHVYAAAGTYTVTVTVYDSNGVSDSDMHDVVIAAGAVTTSQRYEILSRRLTMKDLPYEVTRRMFDG